jgi:spermidine synthase
MTNWVTEYQTSALRMEALVKETLFEGQSDFQKVGVYDTEVFGRLLTLDGVFQTSSFEEYVYHEMISHIPLLSHPNPKQILIIGGGDGGTAREVLKHTDLENVEMVEIDGMVVELSKKYLPQNSSALNNPPANFTLTIGDGIQKVKDAKSHYDLIIVDCSDPIGPGEGLFAGPFYKDVYNALKEDGLFVQQTESPFYHRELLAKLTKDIKDAQFPIVNSYLAHIPIYPGGCHSFTIGSKKYHPQAPVRKAAPEWNLKYYNEALHSGAFALPNFVTQVLDGNLK